MALTTRPKHKPTIHDRKRHGQHHKVSKQYTHTYWPYLPMFLVLLMGIVLNFSWKTSTAVLGYATSMSPSALLQLTNDQRSQNGLGGLSTNGQLAQAAQAKANDMAARDYWSHVTPDGKQPWSFMSDAGYSYSTAGENLAYGFDTSSGAITGWMNSPEHKANILNSSYQEVGFGIANASNYQGTGEETIVVAMYAKPLGASAPVAKAPAASNPAKTLPATKQATPQTQEETPAPAPVAASTPTQTTTNSDVAKAQEKPVTKQAAQNEQKTQALSSKQIARVDLFTQGNAQWASLAISAIASIAIIAFLVKHGKLWRRYLLKGEHFVIKHPVFDTALVAVAVIGFTLTRISGFIQ